MSGRITRWTAVAGVSVLAVAALAGCGGSSTPSAGSNPAPAHGTAASSKVVLASVQATAAAKSARVSLTVSSSGLGAISLNGDGAIDFANGNSQFTLKVGGAAAAIFAGGFEERSVDGVVYVRLPLPTGDVWYSVAAGKSSGASTLFPGLGNTDPQQFLAALEAVSDNVTKVGTETVRGVETTHYHAELDLSKEIDQAKIPKALRGAAQKFLQANGAQTPTMPVDVFIDGNGYVRRITLDFGSLLSGLGDGGSGSIPNLGLTESIDLYDFGTPVNVQAPPADQVTEIPTTGGLGSPGGLGGALGGQGSVSN